MLIVLNHRTLEAALPYVPAGRATAVCVPGAGHRLRLRYATERLGRRGTRGAHRSAATSDHAADDKSSATVSSLDHVGTKSLRPAVVTGRMNDT